ncbi:MAG: PTS sugar transporter subunit IIA [Planctomycetes bacterium]|nr:PTS sugar transporter subunit IIA [Planctomycetota bacterium]
MQLSLRDVAAILNVPEYTIYRWISDKQLPTRQINGQYRFNSVQLFEWATLHHIDISPRAFAQFTDEKSDQVRFDVALEVGGIIPNIQERDPAGIIRQIVAQLPLPANFDRQNLVSLIISRNGLRATSIGEGIALPHPRSPIVIPGRPPAVTLGFLEHPLPMDTVDGKPIQAIFLLQSPTVRAHLQLLARLAFAARDDRFHDLLLSRASASELLAEAHRIEESFRGTNGEHLAASVKEAVTH